MKAIRSQDLAVFLCFCLSIQPCVSEIYQGHYASANSSDSNTNTVDSKQAEQILNDIVSFGIDQSDRLENVRERQLFEQGVTLKKSNPAHFVGIFNKQKPKARELSSIGYASLQASSLLARQ